VSRVGARGANGATGARGAVLGAVTDGAKSANGATGADGAVLGAHGAVLGVLMVLRVLTVRC